VSAAHILQGVALAAAIALLMPELTALWRDARDMWREWRLGIWWLQEG